ncbi:ripply2 [Pelobates cultripes]|uniref:Ripply2 n=1 Tax=Pelobates cultripes TaxID=61616 RepID=A0AAD1VQG5_PELCU|nr:ripply2 [Pelobates cultripes]
MDSKKSSECAPTKSEYDGAHNDRCVNVWRPWNDDPKTHVSEFLSSTNLLKPFNADQGHFNDKLKLTAFQHPVKLFWPKSRCFDFLYQEAENLLRNFPVQATISLYQETDSSSSDEEDAFLDDDERGVLILCKTDAGLLRAAKNAIKTWHRLYKPLQYTNHSNQLHPLEREMWLGSMAHVCTEFVSISHNMFWRPWLLRSSRKDGKVLLMPDAYSLCENNHFAQKHTEYSHPVRLFWPKSKSISHMYREANDLLRNFPVQATISFYNDSESDTDNEDDQSEEELDSGFESA